MRLSHCPLLLALALSPFAASSCVPKRDLPPDQIERLTKLADVMDVQSTVADPQFKKIGAASYDDAEEDDLAESHDHDPDPGVHDPDPAGEQ